MFKFLWLEKKVLVGLITNYGTKNVSKPDFLVCFFPMCVQIRNIQRSDIFPPFEYWTSLVFES